MIKHYFKQALQMLKENPLVNTISILGTALSIAMILVIVLVFQINNAGYPPESNRDKMLYVLAIRATNEKGNSYGSYMSEEVVKDCFYSLQTPKAVTAFAVNNKPISMPSKRLFMEYDITYTDPGFWKVFDFTLLHGVPFSEEDFQSGIPRIVISAKLASQLFGSTNVVGKQVILDNVESTVCGIVKTVSKSAEHAYADAWVPYTVNPDLLKRGDGEGLTGNFRVILLADSKKDFEAIRNEINRQVLSYNNSKEEYKANFMENPFTRMEVAVNGHGFAQNTKKSVSNYLLTTGAILLFLLLIPALNLIGVVQSSVQKRKAEMGIRKAFGATKGTMTLQILSENMVITAIGSIIGFGLSFLFLILGKSFLLSDTTLLTGKMLFQPLLFISVIVFAFLLNFLSAGIPARRISRQTIVNALNETES